MRLPDELRRAQWQSRLDAALAAVEAAGAALMVVRGSVVQAAESGDQLKTSVDLAAEGWVLGWLEGEFSKDVALAEERFASAGGPWEGRSAYWTVDALDGTRSFVEGYPGFCVQVAWVEGGTPRVGVIGEPAAGVVYVAAEGAGAWCLGEGSPRRLRVARSAGVRFVDSTPPGGVVGEWMQRARGSFVECGSVGLKIARIAEDAADIYAKDFRFRLWDVAPGDVLIREAGGRLGLWDGSAIDYSGSQVEWHRLLATPVSTFESAVSALAGHYRA